MRPPDPCLRWRNSVALAEFSLRPVFALDSSLCGISHRCETGRISRYLWHRSPKEWMASLPSVEGRLAFSLPFFIFDNFQNQSTGSDGVNVLSCTVCGIRSPPFIVPQGGGRFDFCFIFKPFPFEWLLSSWYNGSTIEVGTLLRSCLTSEATVHCLR